MYPASRPTSALELCQKEPVMQRYLERYERFSQRRDLGLIQWQLAQAMDLFAQGEARGAADLISQLMIMVEQLSLDGRSDLAWLLTLQHDPPAAIFVDHQALPSSGLRPFSPLADQKLVSTTLAFIRELETLSSKRAELVHQDKACPSFKASAEGRRAGRRPAFDPQTAARQALGREESRGPKAFRGKLSLFKWAAALPRLLLATRTSFARFLKSSFSVTTHSDNLPPNTALFPGSAGCFRQVVDLSTPLSLPLVAAARVCSRKKSCVLSCGTATCHRRQTAEGFLPPPWWACRAQGNSSQGRPFPDTARDSAAQTLSLCKLWDSLGLLKVFPGPREPRELCRVFGSFKDTHRNRMIGDRGGPNSLEGSVIGVSKDLPAGVPGPTKSGSLTPVLQATASALPFACHNSPALLPLRRP